MPFQMTIVVLAIRHQVHCILREEEAIYNKVFDFYMD